MRNSLELSKHSNESLPAQVEQYLYQNLPKNVANLVINQINLQCHRPVGRAVTHSSLEREV